ncbi:HYR domain-containing protein [Maribellus sp. CM-23]|uniref:HYR domain-containing protein n=1 Tax=Maribellus sp. CM-23 TaxID=2781026 RepID=UPI001F430A04|nr:HYR domain-containing protein [Maribellus sp. CM-23]MCE4566171.1 HYR domain-containing protein [Maribellus sp. CM-23]
MIVALSVFMDTTSVKAGVLRAVEGGSVNIVTGGYGAPDNIHFSKISDNNAFLDDTIGIVCPEDISTYTDVNACNTLISSGLELIDRGNTVASLSWQMEGATEGSSSASGVNQLTSYVFNEGTTLVTYRGKDRSNQPIFCSFVVVVADNEIPRLMNPPGNISVEADPGDCHAVVNWQEPIVLDNCASRDQIIVDANYMPGSAFPIGTTEVFFSISDGVEYNRDEYSFTVTVTDDEKPEIYAPNPIRVKCGDPVPEAFTSWREFTEAGGVAFDNCNIEVESFRFVGQKSNGIRCPYTVTRTYSIADDYGNLTEVEHLVYVTGEEEVQEEPQPELVLKSAMAGTITAIASGNWNDPNTWDLGRVPLADDDVVIPSTFTVTLTDNAVCQDITINGVLNYFNNGAYTLQVSGDWSNSGTYNGGTNGVVEFIGSNPASISGTTNFEGLVINKGSLTTILTVSGTATVLSSGLLTMTSGLVTIPGGGSFAVNPAIGLTIEQAAGFDVTGGALTTGNFSITNEGLIQVSAGTASLGNTSGNEVHTQVDGAFVVAGGNVDIAGWLYNSASGTLTPPGITSGISISGGTITLATEGNGLSSVGSLHVTSAGNFSFTGGTIVFETPSSAATELDLGLLSGGGTKNTVGGTFQFGNTSTPPGSVFNVSSDITLNRITSSANADLVLDGNLLVNDLSLNSATTINLNGFALRREVSGLGNYTFPLDDGSGNSIPVTVTLTAGSNIGSGDYIEVTTTDGKPSANANTSNYISRYWEVDVNGITSPEFDATFTYSSTNDVTGLEANIAAGSYSGSLPWVKYGAANAGANTISVTGISGNGVIFTGITLAPPTVEINGGVPSEEICTGSSVVLTAVPTGDPGWTYSWSPSTGLSATNIAAPTANPTSDQTYTVTVTDGNGFTAQDDIQVIVNLDHTISLSSGSNNQTVCSNNAITPIVYTIGGGGTGASITSGSLPNGVTESLSGNTFTISGTPTESGIFNYTVTSTGNSCNAATANGTITVNPDHTITLSSGSNNQTVCINNAITPIVYTIGGGGTGSSITSGSLPNGVTGSFSGNTFTISGTPTESGTFNFTVTTSGNSCNTATANGTITVNPDHTITLSSAAGTDNQEFCLPDALTNITYVVGGGATGANVSGSLPSGVSGSYSGGIFTISGTPTVAGTFNYTVTTSGNSCGPETASGTITVHPTPTVKITISPNSTICAGTNVVFTTTATDEGDNPTFEWQSNTGSGWATIPGETGTSYSSSSLVNAQSIRVIMTADPTHCSAVITSNSYVMTVNPTVVPSVTVSHTGNDICDGESVTFDATITNPGTSPTYQWQLSTDGTNWSDISGATNKTYTTSSLSDGDQIRVFITSNANCASPADAVSTPVVVTVHPIVVPTVSITANTTTICPGETVNFSIDGETNPGSNPFYQWKVNGVNVGTDLPTYSSASLTDGDEVTLQMTSNARCASPVTVGSNVVTMLVNPGTPAIPGAITGSIAVCPGVSETYSIAAVTDATVYTWTVPAGWTIDSGQGTTSITVTTGTGGTSGNISVTAGNTCGTGSPRTLAVSVGTLSSPATSISNPSNNTCEGTSKTLTRSGGTLGTGAQWVWYTGSCGDTKVGTGTSITVNPSPGTYTYWVRAEGTCDTTACISVDVTVSPGAPLQPGAITGTTPVCPGESFTYFTSPVADAASYAWSVPGGWTITGGQGDTLITVTAGSTGQNGNISVTASNSCGTSTARTLAVTVAPGEPATPGVIAGLSDQCTNSTGLSYSVSAVANASSYSWVLPTGWTITGGSGTNSITVSTDGTAIDGMIKVAAENSCGVSDTSYLPVTIFNSAPATPGPIDGVTAICPAISTLYTIDPVTDAQEYTWSVPAGWIIESGQGTTSLSVTVPIGASSGNVTVTANNICGNSTASTLAVSAASTGSVYAGPDIVVCEGISFAYMAGEIGGAIDRKGEWDWESITYPENLPHVQYFDDPDNLNTLFTFPTSFTSGTAYIRIFTTSSVAGCGVLSDTMKITILPRPEATIVSTDTVCEGEDATVTISATPNSTVTYRINLDVPKLINIDNSGTAAITLPGLTSSASFRIISVKYNELTNCQAVIDTVAQVVVNQLAVVEAGPDQTLCSASPEVNLAGSVTGAVTTGTWSGGAGVFTPNANTLNAVYSPTPSEVSAGTLTLTLTSEDPSGPCLAVLDQMIITFDQAATVDAGVNQEMCSDGTVPLSGSIGGAATSATWSGGGSFAPNASTLNAVYTPSASEQLLDSFRLILTSNDPGGVCAPASDTVWIYVHPGATVDAGTDQVICASSTVTLNGLVGGGATAGTWTGGNGTFTPDATALNAVYSPSADEISDGSVTLTLTTSDPDGPCGPVSDQVVITIDEAATVNAGIDASVCEGSDIILAGSVGGAASSAVWTGGAGTFTPNRNTVNATYTHAPGEFGDVMLVLTTDDPSGTCAAVADTMILTVDSTISVTVGNDTMICSDATITLDGWVESGTGTWSTNGSGSFSSVTDPNAVYTPSTGDIYNGLVTLTFTTEDPDGICGPVSASMQLTVKEVITVTTQPVNTGVCSSYPANIFVQAVGDDLTYQWFRGNGTPVNNTANITGAQTATLNFANATSGDTDSYYVVISSPTACDVETSDTVTLNVDEEISVTTPLVSDSICVGSDVTFNIVAEPGGLLSYQWRKDGVDIPGKTTNTLILTNLTPADAGSYTVYMTGLEGYTCQDAESAPGELFVIDNASILPTYQSDTFCLDASIDTMIYTIDGGATSASVTAGSLPAGLVGTYDVATRRFLIYGAPTAAGEYNFTVTTTGYCVQASASGLIVINNQLNPPLVSASQVICYNSVPAALTVSTPASGGSGPYLYQWQDSVATGNWADITGATAVSYTPPALIEETYFRVIATDDGYPSCGWDISNVVTVTPFDTAAPTFAKPDDFTLTANDTCGGDIRPVVTGKPLAVSYNDNCSDDTYLIANTTYSDHSVVPGACGSSYSFSRTWVVTDEAGNSSEQTQIIYVEDKTAPTFTSVPTAMPLSCEQDTSPSALGFAVAADNCDPNPVVSYYDTSVPGTCAGSYTFIRHWIATDACGNADTIARTYNVQDNVKPVIINAGDTTVDCVGDIPEPDASVFEYYDECGSTTIELIDEIAHDLDNESGYCPYQVVRTWRVTDDCLNKTEFVQTIYVRQLSSCPACSECLYDNTLNIADFTGDPDGDTTFVDVIKQDKCCGAENVPGAQTLFCASFKIRLDEGAVGVEILIDHVTPPGQDWKLNCEDIDGGDVVCLPSNEWQLFTFCKNAASNQPQENSYTFRSVKGLIASGDIETREECNEVLSVSGDFSNPRWTSVYPGNPGDYDHLLSSTTDTIVYFNAEPGSPPHIQYAVCGDISATLCASTTGGVICDTVDVYVRPAIEMELNINPDLICIDYVPTVSPIISPAGAYDLEWYHGATPSGAPVATGPSYTPPSTGWYSVVAIDNATGLDCNRDTFSFEMKYDLTGPTIKEPPLPLMLDCNTSNYAQLINDWLASATAEYVNDVGDTIHFTPTNDYYDGPGVNMICGDSTLVTFTAMDQCSNDTTATSYIIVIDTTKPIIDPEAMDSSIQCSTTDPDQEPAFLAWLANHGGARATDVCDPDLEWSVDTASTTWTGDPANNQRTVTFTVTDDCGNFEVTTATFSIIDTVPPDLTCPDDVEEEASPDLCSKVPDTMGDPIYSDDCSTPVLTWRSTGALISSGNGVISGIAFPVGVTTITYKATDAAGLSDSCSFTVTIVDVTPPNLEISNCIDVSGTMDATDCFAYPPIIDDPDFSDDCWPKDSLVLSFEIVAEGGVWDTTGFGYVSGFRFPVGVSTVTYTVTDPDSNSVSCDFTVTMLRDEIPWTAITCPANPPAVVLGPTECERAISLTPPTVDDYCVTATYIVSNNYNNDSVIVNETFPTGTTEVVWYITDNSGNVDSCIVYVEVNGIQLPTITCPPNVSGTMTADDCFAVPPTIDTASYSAPCWPKDSLDLTFHIINGTWDTTGVGEVDGLEFPAGTSTVWYIVTDPDGNKDSCSFTVAMLRDAIPSSVIVCPPNPTPVNLGANECDATISLPQPTINESCTTVVYSFTNNYNNDSIIVNETFPTGTTEVTWYITDNSGNVDSCKIYVEVNGIQLPTITCPPNVSGTMTADDCFAVPPTIDTASYSAPCWPKDSLDLTFHIINGTWDTTGVGEVDGLEFPAGTSTVWYIVTDPDGNKDSCSFTVAMLRDAIPSSVIVCPPNPTPVNLGANECDATISLPQPTINESCTTVVYSFTNNYNNDSIIVNETFPTGTTEVTWYITDNSGNVDSCKIYVEVNGIQLPTITCPPNVSGTMTADDCFAVPPTIDTASYSAPCWPKDSLDLTFHIINGTWDTTGVGEVNGLEFPAGTNTVWYIITDPDGNKDSCDFTVTMLQDAIPSTAYNCPVDPADATVDSSSCDAYVTIEPPTINEHCITATYIITHDSEYGTDSANASGYYPIGQHTVTWTISDNSGNDTTCIQTFEVFDLLPVLNCPEPVVVYADFNEEYASGVTVGLPYFKDNCDSTLIYKVIPPDSSLTVVDTALSGINLLTGAHTYDLGVTTIWYIFEDGHNHIDSCSFTVTVLAAPVIECPPDTTVYADDNCEFLYYPGEAVLIEGAQPIDWTWTLINPDGSTLTGGSRTPDDGLDPQPIVSSVPHEYPFKLGKTTIIWTATNTAGADTCEHYITVIDTTPPKIYQLDSLEDCMEEIISAVYSATADDLYEPDRPDYLYFAPGDTTLDLTVLNDFNDNCELNCGDSITWVIDLSPYTDQHGVNWPAQDSAYYGSGQISEYGVGMWFPGDGTYMGNVEHWVSYFVTDCAGNTSLVGQRKIIVTPRPKLIKMNTP